MHGLHLFQYEHVTVLVLLSYVVSVLGAYCALSWASLVPRATGWHRTGRLAAAAVAMGGGAIWSMHFIAMLACRLPVAATYDVPLTLASMLVAIAVSGGGLSIVSTGSRRGVRLLSGGLFAGLGIAGMHYTGMAAMQVPAAKLYSPPLVAVSIAIAVAAAAGALWIAFTAQRGLQRVLGALVMGGAVCGMHYTGMAAVTFVPIGTVGGRSDPYIQPGDLGLWVFGATVFVLGLLTLASRVEAREQRTSERAAELAGINETLRAEIVERTRVESALRESEGVVRGILDAALDAVITMDQHGTIIGWNRHAETVFGWPSGEATGRRLSATIVPPRLRDAHERGLRHYLATGEGPVLRRRVEVAAMHRDGHEFPVELAISPGESGGHPIFYGFVRDISERKRAEDTLRESTMYLNTLIEHSPMAIVARDASLRVRLINPAFERLFGFTRAEIVGSDLDTLIAPSGDAMGAEAAEVTRRVRNGETVHVTTVRCRKDGTPVDVEIYGVPLTEGDRTIGTYALYHDITAQRQLEEQLRQSQKIEAVGTLAGGIAHDFNNLLTSILGYTDLVDGALAPDSPLRADLHEIRKAGQRAESLTRQLLAFSRKQLSVLKVLDVRDIVREMETMLRPVVGEDIDMVTVAAPSDARVRADRGQIEQVLINLVVNARDAMPQGGKLTIEIRNVDVQAGAASLPADVQPGRYVSLSVRDTGIGMDADTRERIFEPFFSTKAPGRGTGLGLSTVYGIVKQAGGHITVDTGPARGACFTVWLPRVDEPLSPIEPRDVSAPAGGNETILLVEDEPAVRKLVYSVLSRQGYRVLEAANGEEALRAATATPVDLVLTDAVMPGMPLDRIITQLRAARPGIRILIMSGYTNEAIVRRGILQADIPFIQKPFASRALLLKVRVVLESGAGAGT